MQSNKKSEYYSLSSRERQILILVASGKTGNQISSELNVSYETVKLDLSNIRFKLSAKNTPQAGASANKKPGGCSRNPRAPHDYDPIYAMNPVPVRELKA